VERKTLVGLLPGRAPLPPETPVLTQMSFGAVAMMKAVLPIPCARGRNGTYRNITSMAAYVEGKQWAQYNPHFGGIFGVSV